MTAAWPPLAPQLLLVSFAGYAREPAEVVKDVLLHSGLPLEVASASASHVQARGKLRNSRAGGKGRMSQRMWQQLVELYMPFVERFYAVVSEQQIAVSPCSERGTRFLDPANTSTEVKAEVPNVPRPVTARGFRGKRRQLLQDASVPQQRDAKSGA